MADPDGSLGVSSGGAAGWGLGWVGLSGCLKTAPRPCRAPSRVASLDSSTGTWAGSATGKGVGLTDGWGGSGIGLSGWGGSGLGAGLGGKGAGLDGSGTTGLTKGLGGKGTGFIGGF